MRYLILTLIPILLLAWMPGCAVQESPDLAATTLPVYEFTTRLCQGTGLTVGRIVTESVSCLHDYTLRSDQMRIIQGADAVVISGAGLEDFMEDALHGAKEIIDASQGLSLLDGQHHHHTDAHEDEHHGHVHEEDPHIWLSPENAKIMSRNICQRLTELYPQYAPLFASNLSTLEEELRQLQAYGENALAELSCRKLVTFHDGFSYFAESFGLTILAAVEEESGSEASAKQLIQLAELVDEHNIPSVFTEVNGSVSAADILSNETGVKVYSLDMAMAGDSYFSAMKYNIDQIREAMQ